MPEPRPQPQRGHHLEQATHKPPWVVPLVVSVALHALLAGVLLSIPPKEAQAQDVIQLVDRRIEIPQPKLKPKPKKALPAPKKKLDPTPKTKTKVRKRRRRRVATRRKIEPPTKVTPPVGDPKGENKQPNTGRKVFGLPNMSSTSTGTKAPALPRGDSLRVKPSVTRRGAPSKGFKRAYRSGEPAPVAVITTKPLPTKRVQPEYPERIRDLGIEGRVRLQLTIDGTGRVISAKIIRSLHPVLDKAARLAAMKMRFKPATVNGTPVRVTIPYSFAFVLD